jgi:hypothetical protein
MHAMRYDEMDLVWENMAAVTESGAGPPLDTLYLENDDDWR